MAQRIVRSFPLAYHISLQTYGSWLPGDQRGWHRRGDGATTPPRPGAAALRGLSRKLQCDPTVTITEPMAVVILDSIAITTRSRGWRLYAAAVIPSHVHVVVGAAALGVTVIQEIAAESAQRLSAQGLRDPSTRFWSAGGYFSKVHTGAQLERVVEYVNRHHGRE